MKIKNISVLGLTITILSIFTLVVSISAVKAQTLIETTGVTGISNTIDGGPVVNPPAIRDRIRADLDSKMQNARNNQEVRNQMIEGGYKIATTTSPRPPLQKPIKYEKMSSSTSPYIYPKTIKERENEQKGFQGKTENEGRAQSMAIEMLKEKRDNLGRNLEVALRNLVDLRKRISSRIEKDRNSGKDLSKVTPLLKVADSKIAIAKQAVDAVKAYKPENSTPIASSTTRCAPFNTLENERVGDTNNSAGRISSSTREDRPVRCPPVANQVNLDEIRVLVDKAQSAIKDAHGALNDVVVAIAKISGNRDNKELPINPPNSPTVSTTTTTNQ